MLSLYIVGCGKENMHTFIAFIQDALKAFIKQNNASFYNLKTLWKAETSAELLKKNARLALPLGDATCEYWGFFNVNDWEALYSNLFSTTEIGESSYYKQYYTASRLKSLLKQIAHPFMSGGSKNLPYDFRIVYNSQFINDSEIMCTTEIDIDSACFDAFDFFYHFVYKLDTFFPDVFLSSFIDDSFIRNFDFKFDREMLAKGIINTGKAFYVSNNLKMVNVTTNNTILQQYSFSFMSNGVWFTRNNRYMQTNYAQTHLNDLLIPQYMVVNWTDLSSQTSLSATDFDIISVYYDKYSSTDPTIIFSRGYSPIQLDCLSKELGDLVLKEQYTASFLFADF